MNKKIQDIKDRLKAATPGPWAQVRGGISATISVVRITDSRYLKYENADLIAHAPTDLSKLIEVIEIYDKALKFYAEGKNWAGQVTESPGPMYCDRNGDEARAALAEAEKVLK